MGGYLKLNVEITVLIVNIRLVNKKNLVFLLIRAKINLAGCFPATWYPGFERLTIFKEYFAGGSDELLAASFWGTNKFRI